MFTSIFHGSLRVTDLTNKARNKQTNEQMHGRNIWSGRDSNQGLPDKKANTITTELMEFSLMHLLVIVFKFGSSHT